MSSGIHSEAPHHSGGSAEDLHFIPYSPQKEAPITFYTIFSYYHTTYGNHRQ